MPGPFRYALPRQHLDLSLCVSSGQVFRWQRQPNGTWFGVDGEAWYQVDTEGVVTSNAPESTFARLFRLDWNARETISEIQRLGPELTPYIQGMPGLRLLRPSSPVEIFFGFLCSANNNLSRILPMCRHLATYGPVIDEVDGQPIHRFPTAAEVAAIPEASLRANGFGYRGATIPAIARQALERGETWIERLGELPYAELHESLISIKGIGRKLADCIALFAYDKTEAVPIDTHLWQAYVRVYRPDLTGTPLTDLRYREASAHLRDRFGPLAGWAHQYLFYDNVLNWRDRRQAAKTKLS